MPIEIPHPIVAGISFAVGMTGVAFGNMLIMAMIGHINRKSPDDEQEGYFGFHHQKTIRIFKKYIRLYPTGRLHIYSYLSFALMFFGMIGLAISLGVIG